MTNQYQVTETDEEYRKEWTPESVRQLAAQTSGLLTPVTNNQDYGASIREVLSAGDTPSEIFSRTEVRDPEEANKLACQFALQADRLKTDPAWADEVWVFMPPVAAALYLYEVFMVSLDRRGRKEAVFVATGAVVPSSWEEPKYRQKRRSRSYRREEAQA